MATILVTGAGGQLGQCFVALASSFPGLNLLTPTRSELDITASGPLRGYLLSRRPNFVLNTAAFTAVDRAETEVEAARQVNAEAPAVLARLCDEVGAHLIHYSTDYVYRDTLNRPLREDDPTEPANVYGATKLAGEEAIRRLLPSATILRTAWVYSAYGHNFVKTMLRLGHERDELRVVYDQVGVPTYAPDLARATLAIIQAVAEGRLPIGRLSGTFNYSNEGACSWYDFALAIFELAGIDCRVHPIESKDFPTPARRPHYSLLNKAKFKQTFELSIPYWRDSLRGCLREFSREKA